MSRHGQRRRKPTSDSTSGHPALSRLSHNFTRHADGETYMDRPESRKAYEEYYHPISRFKGEAVAREYMDRMSEVGQRPQYLDRTDRPFVAADFGTGTGGFSEGALSVVLERLSDGVPVDLWIYDASNEALRTASHRIPKILTGRTVRVHPVRCAFPGSANLPESIDLVLQGNLLAEMNMEASDRIFRPLDEAIRRITSGGGLLWIEPADRISSRRLLAFRDLLIGLHPEFSILAPCPNLRNRPCPALKSDKDWCHEDRPYEFPEEIRRIARMVGHVKDSLKMTYLIATKRRTGVALENPGGPRWRLVSELRDETGLAWGIFCDGAERKRIRILSRHRNAENRTFWNLRRGDTIIPPDETAMNARNGFWDLSPTAEIRLSPESGETTGANGAPGTGKTTPWT